MAAEELTVWVLQFRCNFLPIMYEVEFYAKLRLINFVMRPIYFILPSSSLILFSSIGCFLFIFILTTLQLLIPNIKIYRPAFLGLFIISMYANSSYDFQLAYSCYKPDLLTSFCLRV